MVCLPHAVSFSVFANTLTLSFLMCTWSYRSLIVREVHIGQASTSFGDVSVDSLDGVWVNVSAG